MDYISTLAADSVFMSLLVAGALPFFLFGSFWLGLVWMFIIFFAYGQATIDWQYVYLLLIVVSMFQSSQRVLQLVGGSDK